MIAIQNTFLRKIEFPFERIRSGFSGCRESAAKLCTAGVAILFSDLATCLSLRVFFIAKPNQVEIQDFVISLSAPRIWETGVVCNIGNFPMVCLTFKAGWHSVAMVHVVRTADVVWVRIEFPDWRDCTSTGAVLRMFPVFELLGILAVSIWVSRLTWIRSSFEGVYDPTNLFRMNANIGP